MTRRRLFLLIPSVRLSLGGLHCRRRWLSLKEFVESGLPKGARILAKHPAADLVYRRSVVAKHCGPLLILTVREQDTSALFSTSGLPVTRPQSGNLLRLFCKHIETTQS